MTSDYDNAVSDAVPASHASLSSALNHTSPTFPKFNMQSNANVNVNANEHEHGQHITNADAIEGLSGTSLHTVNASTDPIVAKTDTEPTHLSTSATGSSVSHVVDPATSTIDHQAYYVAEMTSSTLNTAREIAVKSGETAKDLAVKTGETVSDYLPVGLAAYLPRETVSSVPSSPSNICTHKELVNSTSPTEPTPQPTTPTAPAQFLKPNLNHTPTKSDEDSAASSLEIDPGVKKNILLVPQPLEDQSQTETMREGTLNSRKNRKKSKSKKKAGQQNGEATTSTANASLLQEHGAENAKQSEEYTDSSVGHPSRQTGPGTTMRKSNEYARPDDSEYLAPGERQTTAADEGASTQIDRSAYTPGTSVFSKYDSSPTSDPNVYNTDEGKNDTGVAAHDTESRKSDATRRSVDTYTIADNHGDVKHPEPQTQTSIPAHDKPLSQAHTDRPTHREEPVTDGRRYAAVSQEKKGEGSSFVVQRPVDTKGNSTQGRGREADAINLGSFDSALATPGHGPPMHFPPVAHTHESTGAKHVGSFDSAIATPGHDGPSIHLQSNAQDTAGANAANTSVAGGDATSKNAGSGIAGVASAAAAGAATAGDMGGMGAGNVVSPSTTTASPSKAMALAPASPQAPITPSKSRLANGKDHATPGGTSTSTGVDPANNTASPGTAVEAGIGSDKKVKVEESDSPSTEQRKSGSFFQKLKRGISVLGHGKKG